MRRRRHALALAALAFLSIASPGSSGTQAELLPDLDQAAPYKVSTRAVGKPGARRFLLVFASAVGNVGAGPLIVDGSRLRVISPTMDVTQTLVRGDGSSTLRAVRATMRYVVSETHSHWHLLGFERYELRRPGGALVVRDRKTGFCLGDRFRLSRAVPGAPTDAVFRGDCGKGDDSLLEVREGISVGYGDDYDPFLEGQSLDVTRLPTGRYVLVHRANPDGAVREQTSANNAASALLRLTWPRGRRALPQVVVLRSCPATARCS